MLPELHPFLEREYMLWWPYAYFCLLLLLVTAGCYFINKLIKRYRSNRPLRRSIRRVSRSIHIEDDVAFLKSVALELFSVTHSSSGSTYPSEEWLKSLSDNDTNFADPPYRLLLDACLQSPKSIAKLTSKERELIEKNVTQIIRRTYV